MEDFDFDAFETEAVWRLVVDPTGIQPGPRSGRVSWHRKSRHFPSLQAKCRLAGKEPAVVCDFGLAVKAKSS